MWCLNSPVSAGGYSAYQLVFGSNPVDIFGWGGDDEGMLFAQDTAPSAQSASLWKLRMVARKEVANGKLRRL